ncbi:hypothetical protein AB1N83_009733 [Pleurotus pulmonarius]
MSARRRQHAGKGHVSLSLLGRPAEPTTSTIRLALASIWVRAEYLAGDDGEEGSWNDARRMKDALGIEGSRNSREKDAGQQNSPAQRPADASLNNHWQSLPVQITHPIYFHR